ncbi:MAG TPA: cytochrome P450 [Acidimicrobiales bacterium]|jgi:cytochrome P450|nr:cytochrome P450 [Acidimicrobiales bacterium]
MATPVHELDLPTIELLGIEDREQIVAAFEAVADKHWLARMPLGYSVMRHADVVAILRDKRFHSAISMIPQMGGVSDDFLANRQESILTMEGEPHARLRRLVAPAFTPKAADRLRPFMRDVVNGLLDDYQPKGRGDFVQEICEPYPIPIICELLGAPKDDWKLFSGWATDIFRIFNGDLQNDAPKIVAAFRAVDEYVRELIAERRDKPADDLLSDLIAAEEAGDRLSTDELVMMTEAVLMAGTDTTRNQLACAVALFTEHPEQWARLAEHPELAPKAVEESMRYLGAVRGTARLASEDIEYREVVFPQGTLVVTSLAGANFDPNAFADPHRFDIQRDSSAPQMTFGSGIHHCLGASLARAELQEALPIVARRLGPIEVDGQIEWKPSTAGIWGPARLPLRWSV